MIKEFIRFEPNWFDINSRCYGYDGRLLNIYWERNDG
jgi:hypothetical protein